MSSIFATATPDGISGVAVVRLSGPSVFSTLESLIKELPKPRNAALKRLIDPRDGQLIDQALVLTFRAPSSFTGEDTVELHCHGSRAVLDKLGQVLTYLGLRPAEPGEFSKRALHNGKMDLIDVESLDAVLNAKDFAQLQIAQGQAGQARQELFDRIQSDLVSLMAGCEALIDFPDDDLPEELLAQNHQRLSLLYEEVVLLYQRSTRAEEVSSGLEILLVGPPNAGKSTLLNRLAGYERAIVTDIPGTTRDFVELEMALGSFHVTFVDTAGLREGSTDTIEQIGMDRTRERFSSAALILNLFENGSNPVSVNTGLNIPIWSIETKVETGERGTIGAGLPDAPGVSQLLERIQSWLWDTYGASLEGISFQRERQLFHVKQLQESLEQARHHSDYPELQGESLRQAAQALGHLSGKIHVEDVLDRLFAGFCIGK